MIIITGSAGYIGEELCKHLLNKGENVIQVDSKFNKRAEEYITDNIEFFRNAKYIVHLAAISGIQACQDSLELATVSNILATQHIMKFAADYNIPMIFASSAAANNPTSSFYATTKFLGEQTAKYYNENYDARITTLRFSNVFGGEKYLEKKNSVVAKFLKARENEDKIIIDGDGEQIRDFIHVKRIIEVIDRLIENDYTPSKKYDVCSGHVYSINDIVKLIGNIVIEYSDDKTVGVTSSKTDTSDMLKLMGYDWTKKQNTDILEFINKTLAQF